MWAQRNRKASLVSSIGPLILINTLSFGYRGRRGVVYTFRILFLVCHKRIFFTEEAGISCSKKSLFNTQTYCSEDNNKKNNKNFKKGAGWWDPRE